MNNPCLFRVEDLQAGYGSKEVLKGMSFSVQAGTLTCLIGKNGCGKSTLFKCMTGQLKHRGNCWLKGENMEAMSRKELARNISYIPQKSGPGISLPVLDVVLMGYNPVLKLLERPSGEQIQRAIASLNGVGLGEYVHAEYQTLSEGQKQLVILARMMVEDTSLLLLDEPDSALDFQNKYSVMEQIRSMVHNTNRAGILSLHDPALALEFCDQLLLMEEGNCIAILAPKEDELSFMEEGFRQLYGAVTLTDCVDKKGNHHRTLFWEGMV